MSYVHYKFKNQRGSSVVDFDGPYIPYDELKRDIIRRSLSKSTDFDLKIVDEHTKKEYKDGDQIHKNASVIVSRVPITDKRVHIINNSRFVPQHAQPQHSTASRPEEEDLPQAPQMFNVGPSDKQQILKGKPSPDYECKRCFVRGDHYFQNCPTWNVSVVLDEACVGTGDCAIEIYIALIRGLRTLSLKSHGRRYSHVAVSSSNR
eukprot:TRINITY_DN11795_c1_g3_i8.p1 TRINITY_DN11795_c1_g3~~TRINITY_DN11795_c1_g3_i8.p1  ORF type:complete len:205 (+),score=31.79 TRINITY_DN11795_c1_g3_i8:256-870(+)